jgi:hypothetical protein
VAYNPLDTITDDNGIPVTPAKAVAVAAAVTAPTVVKVGKGRLGSILLSTANGAAAVNVYDSAAAASGLIIGCIPASAPIGTVVNFDMPAANGIVVGGAATNPAMTVSYS